MKILLLIASLILCSCTTARISTQTAPSAQPTSSAPTGLEYQSSIRHPSGMAIHDVKSLFLIKDAPERSQFDKCDFDYQAETMLSKNKEELFTTMPAHVKSDPVRYHWCFYHKILRLEEDLEKQDYIEEKQKLVVERYLFLTHLARIFQVDLDDPRYLDFALHNYKRLRSLYFPR